MNDLQLINRDGVILADSRGVAEMVEKDHRKLLRDIRTYCEYLTQSQIGLSEFFIKSEYQDSTGRTLPCYLITRKGCDMIANKLTGAKGVVFTAKYVQRFEEMEKALEKPQLPRDFSTALRLLADEVDKRQALESENAQQKQIIAEYSPKASYYDVVLQTKDAISASQIAKDYGKSAKWLNDYLHQAGVQFKQGDVWLLYQKHSGQGYTRSKTHTYCGSDGQQHSKLHTYWTQKGRLFIYDRLRADGILPLIEQELDEA